MRMRQNCTGYVSEMITFGDVGEILTFRDDTVGFSGLTYAAPFTINNLMTLS